MSKNQKKEQRRKQRKERQRIKKEKRSLERPYAYLEDTWTDPRCAECGARTNKLPAPILITLCPECGCSGPHHAANSQRQPLAIGRDNNFYLAVGTPWDFVIQLPSGTTRIQQGEEPNIMCTFQAENGRLVLERDTGEILEASGCFAHYNNTALNSKITEEQNLETDL